MAITPLAIPMMSRGLPLLGHATRLMRDPLEFIRSLRDHGDVVAIRLGLAKMLMVNDPELIWQLLVDKEYAFDKGRQHEKLRLWWGEGLSTSNGEFHARQRRMAMPAFDHRHVAQYMQDIRTAAEQRVGSWSADEPIQLDKELCALFVSMVAKTLFSTDISREAIAAMQTTLPIIMDGIEWRVLDTTDVLGKLPLPMNRRFNKALSTMHAVVDNIIENHDADNADCADLLATLMRARDPDTGEAMSRKQVHDEVITIFTAGVETSRSALSWACHLLSTHQDVQREVQAEVDRVLAGGRPELSDLEQLDLTRRVLTETLRLYPGSWLLTRRANTDVDLGQYHVPAGTNLCYSAYGVHRDPRFYSDPDVFDPDRWLPGRDDLPRRTTYIPFSAGTRGCIGERLAWAMTSITLSTIVAHWKLTPASGITIQPEAKLQLMPDKLPMVLSPR